MDTGNTTDEKKKNRLNLFAYVLWGTSGFVLLILIVAWLFDAFDKPLPLGIPNSAFEPLTLIVTIIVSFAGGLMARWGSTHTPDPAPDGILHITVHKHDEVTRGIAGAQVVVNLPEPKTLTTNTVGYTACSFPGRLKDQPCHINAEKEGYQKRQSESITLSPDSQINLALTPTMQVAINGDGNPFVYGDPVPPELFFGRKRQIQEIKGRIATGQSISLVGLPRSGRSSMLKYIEANLSKFCNHKKVPVAVYIDLDVETCRTPDDIWDSIRYSIEKKIKISPWIPRQQGRERDPYIIRQGLEELNEKGFLLIILVDNFEKIKKVEINKQLFDTMLFDWRSKSGDGLLTMVIATERPIDEITRNMNQGSLFSGIFTTTYLGAFENNEWHEPVQERFQRTHKWNDDYIEIIDKLAGGLPFYTQMAASLLWEHNNSKNMEAKFYMEVESRFNILYESLLFEEREYIIKIPQRLTSEDIELTNKLQYYGIIRKDNTLFNNKFADFVRKKINPTA